MMMIWRRRWWPLLPFLVFVLGRSRRVNAAINSIDSDSNEYDKKRRGRRKRLKQPKARMLTQQTQIANACIGVTPPAVCLSQYSKGTCKPFRTPDYCVNSFPTLIAQRKTLYENTPSSIESEGYWFHKLDDKLHGYVFTNSQGFRAPQIHQCDSNPHDLINDLTAAISTSSTPSSFVIRAMGMHSNNGIYVFPDGFTGIEILRGVTMTPHEVAIDLLSKSHHIINPKFVVEEYIPGAHGAKLPTEYKLHTFNGEIGSISIVQNRGTPCGCWAEVDQNWERLDQYGCFTPGGNISGKEQIDPQACIQHDFTTGRDMAHQIKGFNLCDQITIPSACLREEIKRIASELSKAIGVYARIDLFVNEESGEIYVQEYTFNHANGLRHCSARLDGGCINSCFLGDMWINTGGNTELGGPVTPFPVALGSFDATANKCAAVVSLSPNVVETSPCIQIEDIRFSKIPYLHGVPGNTNTALESPNRAPRLPLLAADYPIGPDDALWLRRTGAISVFITDDCLPTECYMTPQELLDTLHITVDHPSSDPTNPYWDDLKEVIEVQLLRKSGADVKPLLKRVPKIWEDLDIAQVAEAVHDEFPGSIHVELVKQLFGGALDKPYEPNCIGCAVVDREIIPSQSITEFIRGVVMLADINTLAFGIIGPINFSVKWFVGRARPEEVVWKIFKGHIDENSGVPKEIIDLIQDNFGYMTKMQDFTAYSEGSPDHPSFPAMHSASSAGSLWLPLVLDLTMEQLCEVKAVDYAIAYARTIAGVHFPTDNIAGLNIGQEILARKLPQYLAEKYGSDPVKVAKKVEALRFDWNDYLTGDCFTEVTNIPNTSPRPPQEIYDHDIPDIIPDSMRFSKIPFVTNEMPEGAFLPLNSSSCPISMTDATWLRQTGAISVFIPDDCLECDLSPLQLLKAAKVNVTHPNPDPHSSYWEELKEVVDAQIMRKNGTPLSELRIQIPKIWSDAKFDIVDVAEAVHDEYPGSIHQELIKQMFGGALDKPYAPNCANCATVDRKIIPSFSATEFIRGAVMLADLNTFAFGVIGPINFQVKWHVGRCRPEEVVWSIYMDRLTTSHGVPASLIQQIKQNFQLNIMQEFTAYPEGSPDHPSFPAMHSASSAASLWMALVLELTHEQWCEVKAVDYAISYARTVAGVHYHTDNIAGLNIGQHILATKLPDHLVHRYGSDRDAVEEKLGRIRFDWMDYLDGECFTN